MVEFVSAWQEGVEKMSPFVFPQDHKGLPLTRRAFESINNTELGN